MKTNKPFHFLILLTFMFQALFSPVLMAQTRLPQSTRQANPPRSVDDLFDESVSARERQLLFEFIQYIANSIAPREGLRKAAEELYRTLEKEKFWFSVDVKDHDMAALLAEANAGRRYLSEKTAPAELRLHDAQRRLEKRIIADHEKIIATGQVPDGFMERTRNLAALYDSQDSLWEMKLSLLFNIGTLSNNVVTNYLSHHPAIYAKIKDRIERSDAEMNDMAAFAAYYNRQVLALKARYQEVRTAYDGALAAELSRDRENTLDMIAVVRHQSNALAERGDANDRHHAELLEQIVGVLEHRVDLIDRQLGQFGVTDVFPNPLYIAPGLGTSQRSRPLAEAYRKIARKFITQTRLKANELEGIKSSLEEVKRSLGQEHIFFQTLLSEAGGIPADKKRDIPEKSARIVTGFIKNLTSLADEVEQIITLAEDLDFKNPDRIIGSRIASAKAFRINRKIEKFILSAGNMEQTSIGVDFKLYALLGDLDFDRAEQLKSYQMLEKTSLARTQAVEDFAKKLASLQALFDDDTALAKGLKTLGRDIINQGQEFYKSKISAVSDLLAQNKSAAGQPYFDFLNGASEQLQGRLQIIEEMIAISEKLKTPSPSVSTPCPGCPSTTTVWPELAELGTAYTDTLQQFDDLDDIESFYKPDKISRNSVLSDTRLLFDLNTRLGNEPFLHLNPGSIDIVFTAGSRMVVIKGIGDPRAIDFTVSALGADYLTQPPYIGGFGDWLSSTVSSINDNWIQPIGRKIKNTASTVVSTATEVGGKIATRTGQLARSALDKAKSTAETIGDYGSSLWEGFQVWGINTWENAFMNDVNNDSNNSYSWLKIGAYALGGTACAIAAAGTAGLAAGACLGLAAAVSVNAAQGAVDTAKDYGSISKESADTTKFILDLVGIGLGGLANIKDITVKAWSKLHWMQKGLTFMGLSPKNLKGLQTLWKADWGKVKNMAQMGGKLVDSLGAWRSIPDWFDKVANWSGYQGLPTMSEIGNEISGFLSAQPGYDGLSSGLGIIRDLMGMGFPIPGLVPYPYSIAYDPLSPLGTGGIPGIFGSSAGGTSPDDASGVTLPGSGAAGSGVWSSGGTGATLPGSGADGSGATGPTAAGPGGTGPGVTLGPHGEIIETPGQSQQWTVPGQTSSAPGDTYGNWKNPYGNLKNPFGNLKNPYRGDNPYRMDNPYR